MNLSPGTRLGPYEVLSLLGAGGMGEVYRANDTRVDRQVALKILPERFLEGDEGSARFAREARALASLNHPNVAVLYSFEEIERRHVLVMELIEGATLRERLDSGPIPPKQAVDYALQMAKGLAAAHEKGIVHRDLKPENVVVSKDGHLKILDFGLAKRTEPAVGGDETSAPTESKHTEPGVVMGTVVYMSPEQVRGLSVDHRSDIFSFGTILYELLSGKRAFKRETAADTMSAILKEEPPDLSESGRNIPPSLDQVVKHCLEKDRSNRFQSAKDIAFALSQTSSKAPMTSGTRAAEPASGKKRAIVITALLALLAFAGILLLRRSGKPPAEAAGPKRIAVLPFENLGAPEEGYFADGMADEVRSKLAGLGGLSVIASASSDLYKGTTKTPEQIAKELGVGYLLVARVRWQKSGQANRIRVTPELEEIGAGGGATTRWQEAFDADLADVFKIQGEIAARVAISLDVVLSGKERVGLTARPTSNLAAYDAWLKGRQLLKTSGWSKVPLPEFEKAVALDPDFAAAWADISLCHSFNYEGSDPSPREADAARIAAERAIALAPNLPWSTVALGHYHLRVRRDKARAHDVFTEGLRAAPDDFGLITGVALAETSLERAVELAESAEKLDPRNINSVLPDGLLSLRRSKELRAACDRGLAVYQKPSEWPRLFFPHRKAMAYLQEGDLASAREVIARALKEVDPTRLVAYFGKTFDLDWALDEAQRNLLLRLPPAAFEDRATWAMVLAQAASRGGDGARVRECAEEARKSYVEFLARFPDQALSRSCLGLSLAYLGKKEEAIREGELALAQMPISKAPAPDDGPYIQHQLARIHILVGDHEKALDLLEPLLGVPYFLTPAWLRIDPNFDPLRKNPRFQKLVAER